MWQSSLSVACTPLLCKNCENKWRPHASISISPKNTLNNFYSIPSKSSLHMHLLAPKKLSFWFKSANCSIMMCGCFRWSGLSTASQQSSWMYWMTRLSHQWIFVFLNDSGIFQYDNAKIHRLWKSGAWGHMTVREQRSHFHTWICHQSPDFNPIKNYLGFAGLTFLSSIQNLDQKLIQLWMEINVVTLHEVVENNATANALCNQSKRRSRQQCIRWVWTNRDVNSNLLAEAYNCETIILLYFLQTYLLWWWP